MADAERDLVRVALVSGVARPPGIGRAVALRLAAAGYRLVCADLVTADPQDTGHVTPEAFDTVMAELRSTGALVHAIAQVEDPDWAGLVAATIERCGRLDVCCALNGATGPAAGDGPLVGVGESSFRLGLELNLVATWLLVRAAAAAMIDRGHPGAIAVLSSQAALAPKAGAGVVGAARAAADHLVSVFAKELGPQGIRINAVAPLAVVPTAQFPNPRALACPSTSGSGDRSRSGGRRLRTRPPQPSSSSAPTQRRTSPA
jgi:NAD(P)-dependent dehydrogenase (short-subunit alcohol dehydrogenase family)